VAVATDPMPGPPESWEQLGQVTVTRNHQKPWCIWGIKHIFEIGWDYQLFSTVILNISQLSNSVFPYYSHFSEIPEGHALHP
jgi:hypothetical protein